MIKDYLKNFFTNRFVLRIVAWLSHFYIYFVYATSKIVIKGNYNDIISYVNEGKGIVLFTWHGRLLISPMELNRLFKNELANGKKMTVLASSHRDGKIASAVASTFNIEAIEGSTIDPKKGSSKNKRSLTSIRTTIKALTNGAICLLASDGPRGPAFKMNTKICSIVKKTKTAIACASISYKHKKQLNTWDFFQLAYPFNTIIIDYGKVIEIPEDANITDVNLKLETDLNSMIQNNDLEVAKK